MQVSCLHTERFGVANCCPPLKSSRSMKAACRRAVPEEHVHTTVNRRSLGVGMLGAGIGFQASQNGQGGAAAAEGLTIESVTPQIASPIPLTSRSGLKPKSAQIIASNALTFAHLMPD
jgi:hypothetical protein